jgi:hypothetical protein
MAKLALDLSLAVVHSDRMDRNTEDWQRLAEHVVSRRVSLGLTQQDVRAAGGPSTATMRLIEGALQTTYKDMVIGRLEKALNWGPGSVRSILAGGDPTPLHATVRPDPIAAAARIPAVRQDASPAQIAQQAKAAGYTSGDLRRAGHGEAANALLEQELHDKYGEKSFDEMVSEARELTSVLVEAIRRKAPHLRDEQLRSVEVFSEGLAKVVVEFNHENRAS